MTLGARPDSTAPSPESSARSPRTTITLGVGTGKNSCRHPAQVVDVDHPYAQLVRGVLLAELGHVPAAIAALETAAEKTDNPHEREEIARRLATLRTAATAKGG